LAETVGGPRATTPDPDAPAASAPAAAASAHSDAADARIERAAVALNEAASLMRGRTTPAVAADDPRLARLAEAINAERVAVYLEPIQGLGDRRPHHFEVSVRLQDASGAEFANDDMRLLGRHGGLMPRIDSVKLPRVLRVARRVRDSGRPADILSALAAESLSDNGFIDRFAAEFNVGERIRIVFAFSEADVRAFGRVHWQTLEAMADMGIRFALEEVTALDLDLERLKRVGFEFVKLDAAVFSSGLPTAGDIIPASDLCSHLSSIGLTVIVSRIEDEWELARVMGFGAVYGQGTLFGGPRPVRADVLAEASAA
jgi:cyclic-di-GMP phosphodiesterase TipF (flagellum assembly factor)